MSRLLAVAARELRERWLLLPGALVAGCFPLLMPALGVSRGLMPTVGATGAALLGVGAAVVIGSSMLARDAADGRLAFLFSRPLHWGTIWAGKWLAAVVLVAASAVLCSIPFMAAYPLSSAGGHHGDSWILLLLDGRGILVGFLFIVVVVGLANLLATAFRSRSSWLALDLVLTLGATWASWRYLAPLWFYQIVGAGDWTLPLALLPLALALVVGSLAQVAAGRSDLRRAQRALSLGFWVVIGLTLAVAAARWFEIRSTRPDQVSATAVTRDGAGRWVYLQGLAQRSGGYPHRFLIDTTTGRYLSRPGREEEPARFGGLGVLFSADGRFAALPGAARGAAGLTLVDLRDPAPHGTQLTLQSSPPPTWKTCFALSPSAATVFVAHESGASLFELPSGRRVATTTIPPGWRPAVARYLAEGSARAWLVPTDDGPARTRRAEMRVLDLATNGATSATTFAVDAAVDPVLGWRQVIADAQGERILTAVAGLQLREGSTGTPLARLVEGTGNSPAFFLGDGRIVVEGRAPEGQPPFERPRVWVFDRAGAKLADFELSLRPPGSLGLGPEVAPGRVVVSSYRGVFLSGEAVVVDVASGAIVQKLPPGLRPAHGFPAGASPAVLGAGSSVHFFSDDAEPGASSPKPPEVRLVRIDFATGERKVVAGHGAPRGERISAR